MREIPHSSVPSAHLIGPARLRIRNRRLLYSAQDGTRVLLDLERLRQLSIYGSVSLSAEVVATLFDRGVSLAWFSPEGARLRGRLLPHDSSTVLRRVRQYRLLLTPSLRVPFARWLVEQRIQSLLGLARHQQRHGQSAAGALLKQLHGLRARLRYCRRMPAIRGIEGASTRLWFDFWGQLFRSPWSFPGRRRRPPTDPINALLSLSAALLTRRATARIEADGLEPTIGALHAFRPGRPSLACDVVEPLRAVFVERFVLQICNRRTARYTDFETSQVDGAVRLKPKVFPRVLARWEEHFHDASGPQRLGRVVAEYHRHLARIVLPRAIEGFDSGLNRATSQAAGTKPLGASSGESSRQSSCDDEENTGDEGNSHP